MQLVLRNSLPFLTLRVFHRGAALDVPDVLVDTGSASTVLSADVAAQVLIFPDPTDRLRTLRGIGGRELVFTRALDRLEVDGHGVDGFEVQIGAMDYGFDIKGILGMNFLLATGAVLDLKNRIMVW
jgi:hypothetical protein